MAQDNTTMAQDNTAIFARLWQDSTYVKLHEEKARLVKVAFGPPSQWQAPALRAWDACCAAIRHLEAQAGVK